MGKNVNDKSLANLKPFEKGKSGNPTGKPLGCRSFKTILKELLKDEIELSELPELGNVPKKVAAAALIVRDATNEDEDPNIRMKAFVIIKEALEGKAKKKIEHSGTIGATINPDNLTPDEKRNLLALVEKAQ